MATTLKLDITSKLINQILLFESGIDLCFVLFLSVALRLAKSEWFNFSESSQLTSMKPAIVLKQCDLGVWILPVSENGVFKGNVVRNDAKECLLFAGVYLFTNQFLSSVVWWQIQPYWPWLSLKVMTFYKPVSFKCGMTDTASLTLTFIQGHKGSRKWQLRVLLIFKVMNRSRWNPCCYLDNWSE